MIILTTKELTIIIVLIFILSVFFSVLVYKISGASLDYTDLEGDDSGD